MPSKTGEKYDLEGPDQVLEAIGILDILMIMKSWKLIFRKPTIQNLLNETTLAKKLFIDVLDDESGTTVQIPVVKKNILGKMSN